MVPDPYKVLGVGHEASADEIKRAYRRLAMQLHPDRLSRLGIAEEEIQKASTKFAAVTAAHAILKDPVKKKHYDHIYRYGGYDGVEEKKQPSSGTRQHRASRTNRESSKGIGYTFVDPVAYVMSMGKVKSQAVAGISIPSRFAMASSPEAGFQVSVSKGQQKVSDTGSIHRRSTTLQFSGGKKHSKVETTHIHRDGRKETLIQGDDYVERRIGKVPRRRRQAPAPIPEDSRDDSCGLAEGEDATPWHAQVMNDISSNIQKCVTPDDAAWHAQIIKDLGSNFSMCVNPDLVQSE